MPDAPLLSIVIVAYRSRDEIAACAGSLPRELILADGTRGGVEAIVVDNSPGDGAGGILRERFPWVTYVAAEVNLGFGRANNLGFARTDSRSEFVLFLNPDTVSHAAALIRCVERLRAEERIGLISPRLELADGTMDLACRRSIPTLWDGFCRASGLAAAWPGVARFAGYNLTHLPPDGTYEVGAINGAFMMGRRAVFEAVAGEGEGALGRGERGQADRATAAAARTEVFDERFFMYGDDLDLCIRVARAGWKIVYDGSVSITHFKGVSVAKEYERMSRAIFDANREVYLKHFNPHGSRWVRWKYGAAFGAWKAIALARARWQGHRRVRPV